MRYYAGIGSRQTPAEICARFTRIARWLHSHGAILRSGAAAGADAAFEAGAGDAAQIFLPWAGFNGRRAAVPPIDAARKQPDALGVFAGVTRDAMELAARYHPAWGACSAGARALHARNGYQVLGPDLASPVACVICWTPGGRGEGGTGQALRIARDHGIAIVDFGLPHDALDLSPIRALAV